MAWYRRSPQEAFKQCMWRGGEFSLPHLAFGSLRWRGTKEEVQGGSKKASESFSSSPFHTLRLTYLPAKSPSRVG